MVEFQHQLGNFTIKSAEVSSSTLCHFPTREHQAEGKERARINCALFLALVKGTEHYKKKNTVPLIFTGV